MAPPLPWRVGERLDRPSFAALRREMALRHCKWDPRVGDVEALCDTPLILRPDAWRELAALAEALDRELRAAEDELRRTPRLHARLALPAPIERLLRTPAPSPRGPRVARYDFHWTDEGWRVSEVNSDVPGGYVEADAFTACVARTHASGASPAPSPIAALADAVARAAGDAGVVALVHATAYVDDAQVMHLLARALGARGLRPILRAPDQVDWTSPAARPAAILRFFPAEWLVELPRRSQWRRFFLDDAISQTNPATAILSQSKRWTLCWDDLATPLPTWRRLCPASHPVETLATHLRDDRVYKPAFGRVGDGVLMHARTPGALPCHADRDLSAARRELRADRRRRTLGLRSHWLAQDRFTPRGLPDDSPDASVVERAVCLGVYVIEGKAAGIYGRVATTDWVNHSARDLAVLVDPEPAPARTLTGSLA